MTGSFRLVPHMPVVLLVEDEASIADNVIFALKSEGLTVQWTTLGGDVLSRIDEGGVDLVILDIGLPDINGMELCKAVRAVSDVPIVFLTARASEIDRIVGLEIGGDDYVVKPFSPRELAARVKAILRRRAAPEPREATRFLVDQARSRISLDGQWLDLSRYEFRILGLLLSRPERIFSRAQIMDSVWDEPDASFDRAVDTHIKTLRAKIRGVSDEPFIRTHRGLGYSVAISPP